MAWADTEPVNEFGTAKRQCLNKAWFSSRKRARQAMKKVMHFYGHKLMAYRCKLCNGWHLSKDKRK